MQKQYVNFHVTQNPPPGPRCPVCVAWPRTTAPLWWAGHGRTLDSTHTHTHTHTLAAGLRCYANGVRGMSVWRGLRQWARVCACVCGPGIVEGARPQRCHTCTLRPLRLRQPLTQFTNTNVTLFPRCVFLSSGLAWRASHSPGVGFSGVLLGPRVITTFRTSWRP